MAQDLAFRPKTSEIPTGPGVYRFLDAKGRVLYVGKAKSLRQRLANYFGPLDALHTRTQRMLRAASDVKWVIVGSEFEALQLEYMWIKEFDPPYNVVFRDDKSYPYLAVSVGETYPRAFVTRNRELKGVKYFGPYTQAWAVRETLDTLLKVYPVRSCTQGIYDRAKRANRPCLLGDIGKCSAPCVGRVDATAHREIVKDFLDFMGGGDNSQLVSLRNRMQTASDSQQYELAASLRDDIVALEAVMAKSAVVFTDQTDADLFAIASDDLAAAVAQFIVRGGRIRGVRGWNVDQELERTDAELVEYVLRNAYEPRGAAEPVEVPKEILVPELPDDRLALTRWLSELRGSKVELRVPQRGDKAALAKTALTNAKHALLLYKSRRTTDFTARADALAAIQFALNMPSAPLRIECFDISHLSGTNVVASMVVFEDGLPKKDQYRQFNIEQTTDDTDSIYQVLTRRLKYLSVPEAEQSDSAKKFAYRPGLLLIDGGKPQVNAAKRALDEAGIVDITVAGIAKRLEELWVPGEEFPVILPRGADELFLVQRIRDEAHRFAITAQRKKRSGSISSVLLDIPGLGEKRVQALIRHFGSATRIRQASADEISEVAGIGPVLAEQIVAEVGQPPAI